MDNIENLIKKAKSQLETATSINLLDECKSQFLGKNGVITQLFTELKQLSIEEKKVLGLQINQLKFEFEELYQLNKTRIVQELIDKKLGEEFIDISLVGKNEVYGSLHPISLTFEKLIKIFIGLGFEIADGPEIESDFYNFQALNIPKNHPARAMQDTFYTTNFNVLRTHTSPMQIRFALSKTPPFKVIAPGKVYRVDMDATHSPMFHQIEVLWIDEGINFANLKAFVIDLLRAFFEDDKLQIRFRASFFPFTEPSAEVDILNRDNKWLEILGCGMVHPNVLTNMCIDPNKYKGFAIGLGVDRLTMLKFGINDLRLLFENDLDFLKQFSGV